MANDSGPAAARAERCAHPAPVQYACGRGVVRWRCETCGAVWVYPPIGLDREPAGGAAGRADG